MRPGALLLAFGILSACAAASHVSSGPRPGDGGSASTQRGVDLDAFAPRSRSEPSAEAQACNLALNASGDEYWKVVDQQTSIQSTRMLLRRFANACAMSLPDLAKA